MSHKLLYPVVQGQYSKKLLLSFHQKNNTHYHDYDSLISSLDSRGNEHLCHDDKDKTIGTHPCFHNLEVLFPGIFSNNSTSFGRERIIEAVWTTCFHMKNRHQALRRMKGVRCRVQDISDFEFGK